MAKILLTVIVCFVILWFIHGSYGVEHNHRSNVEKQDFYFDDTRPPVYKTPAKNANDENYHREVNSFGAIREPEKNETHKNVTQENRDSTHPDHSNWNLERLMQYFVVLLQSLKEENNDHDEEYSGNNNDEDIHNLRRINLNENDPQNNNRKYKDDERDKFDSEQKNSSEKYETDRSFKNEDENSHLKVIEERKTNVNVEPEFKNQEVITEPQVKIKENYDKRIPNMFKSKNMTRMTYKDDDEFDSELKTSPRKYEIHRSFKNEDENLHLKAIEERKTNTNIKPEFKNQEAIPKLQVKIKENYDKMIPNMFKSKNMTINNPLIRTDQLSGEFIDEYVNYPPTNVFGAKNETSTDIKVSYPDKTKHEMNEKMDDPLIFKTFSRLKLNNRPMSEATNLNNKNNFKKIPHHQHVYQYIKPQGIVSYQSKQPSLQKESKIQSYSNDNRNNETTHNQPTNIFNTNPQSSIRSRTENAESLHFENNYMKRSRNIPQTVKTADDLENRPQIKSPHLESLSEKYFQDQVERTRDFDKDSSPAKRNFRHYVPKTSEYISEHGNTEKPNNTFLSSSNRGKQFIISPNNPKTFYSNTNYPKEIKLTSTTYMSNQTGPTNVFDRNPKNSSVSDDSPKNPSKNKTEQLSPETDIPPQEVFPKEKIPQFKFNNSKGTTNLERNNNTKEEIAQNDPNSPTERKIQTENMSNQNGTSNVFDGSPENFTALNDSPINHSKNENKQLKHKTFLLSQEKSPLIEERITEHTFNNPKGITNSERNEPEEDTPKNDPTESEVSPTDSPNTITLTEQFSPTFVDYPIFSQTETSTKPADSEPENVDSNIDTEKEENDDSEELEDDEEEEEADFDEDKVQEISNFQDPEKGESESPQMSKISSEPFTNSSMKVELPANFTNEDSDSDKLPTQETYPEESVQNKISKISQTSSEPQITNSMKKETPITLEKETKTNEFLPTEGKYNSILEFLYQHSNNSAILNMKALKNIACNIFQCQHSNNSAILNMKALKNIACK